MSVHPIEELLAERAHLVKQVADLRARYGPGGTYGDLRKVELCKIAGLLRAELVRDGGKITEAALDQQAHADPRYVAFVTTATQERAQWTILEDQIQGVDETVMRGQAVARFVSAEAHLA